MNPMGQKKYKGECVFCGNPATTRDHVPPQGVFPDPKPTDLITVPACESCNLRTTLDEEYFRWLVATGSAESENAVKLVKERILPKFQRRPAFLHHVMKGATRVDVHSEDGIYLGKKPAFHFDRHRIQVVIEKIVRGLYFRELDVVLPQSTIVGDFVLNPIFAKGFKEVICALLLQNVGKDVFSYRYWANKELLEESSWFLMFFDKTLFFTKTEPSPALKPTPKGGAA